MQPPMPRTRTVWEGIAQVEIEIPNEKLKSWRRYDDCIFFGIDIPGHLHVYIYFFDFRQHGLTSPWSGWDDLKEQSRAPASVSVKYEDSWNQSQLYVELRDTSETPTCSLWTIHDARNNATLERRQAYWSSTAGYGHHVHLLVTDDEHPAYLKAHNVEGFRARNVPLDTIRLGLQKVIMNPGEICPIPAVAPSPPIDALPQPAEPPE